MGCDIFQNWLQLCPLEANLVRAVPDPSQQRASPLPPSLTPPATAAAAFMQAANTVCLLPALISAF